MKCRIVWFFICFFSLGLVYAKSAVGVHDSAPGVHHSIAKSAVGNLPWVSTIAVPIPWVSTIPVCRGCPRFHFHDSMGVHDSGSTVGVHDYSVGIHESGIKAENRQRAKPGKPTMTMAPRLESLEGKTIYIVDMGYPDSRPFIEEIRKLFEEKYPKTKWIIKKKTGSYFDDDPELWREIKENGHGVIMAIGH